ncbi:riboflavin synthase [Paenibacillus mucilaginosus]|uniref:Riboflavin synthase n=2 Tax=Paenibacillus mucilaginosus TaxID=61624 RepID=H6NMH1_9BACL|nr:riboflavin synthase [Paenibacillus mucilaginosus]AEI41286.1 RibE [Paenibacillus mucilaginosus KNP414]AFC29837.1 RibE [Paenibacillus mucilaginosus 3016]MCG7211293.1 riboflavin synthase [Paenibacillus mucilaginosus]WDM30317.1 riboflavin synthase [Paenibacillus mucilaginosus]WFA18501.1 riboflavin synthase [Paenibacillus mucilaginosus]
MFTGIIEEIGTLRRIARQGEAMVLTIGASRVLEDVKLGDSISVNGVCLTVVSYDKESFTVDVMPETFRRTNLERLSSGSPLNLERAMAANGRFGGHIVQGHVDSTGTIVGRTAEANAVVFRVSPKDPGLLKYVLPHGSITIDGISLTVVEADNAEFTVSIIPHTLAETVLQHKKPGDEVNLEADVLGKYIERLLGFQGGQGGSMSRARGRLTADFLSDNGFL